MTRQDPLRREPPERRRHHLDTGHGRRAEDREQIRIKGREPFPGWSLDPDPLRLAETDLSRIQWHPDEWMHHGSPPEPAPRRLGCSVLLLVLLLALSSVVPGVVADGVSSRSPVDPAISSVGRAGVATYVVSSAGSIPARGVNAGPTGEVGTVLIGGWATFYDVGPGRYAAAGPLIRAAIPDWRGKTLRVVSGDRSTLIRLIDACACGDRHDWPTLLDLSPTAFTDLAPLSQGIVFVEIELVALPATDVAP